MIVLSWKYYREKIKSDKYKAMYLQEKEMRKFIESRMQTLVTERDEFMKRYYDILEKMAK